MPHKGAVFTTILLLLSILTLSGAAQDISNQDIVQIALAVTHDQCSELGRDQACYGHARLTAEPQRDISAFQFDAEGDRTSLTSIQSIKLSGLDAAAGTWGVALMQLRANLPASKPDNVTVVAFGDVELTNAVLPPTYEDVQVNARQNINVRVTPSTEASVIGTIAGGQTVTAVERLSDKSWLRVRLPESDLTGWVFADLVTVSDDLEALNVGEGNSSYYEPMQAFYFRSGVNDPSLSALPENGLLIQSPEGVGEVQLLINEINIQLGSTVFFKAQPNGMMSISTLEGHADVTSFGSTHTAFAGTTVTVPLGTDLAPSGGPSLPVPYDEAAMNTLPLGLLPRAITVSAARTLVEIQDLVQQEEETLNPTGEDSGGACCSTDENGECDGHGQSCKAPGHSGECPGNSCDNPGPDAGRAQGNTKGNTGKKDK